MKNLACVLCLALFWSCTSPRYVYTPSAVNNPFLSEKGDGEINAMYSTSAGDIAEGSTGSSLNGLDLMGSYALSNHFGVQAHYYYRGEKNNYTLSWSDEDPDGTIKYNRNEFEIGIGGFVPLDKSKSIFFSGWAGMGFGGTGMNEFAGQSVGGENGKTGFLDYKTTRLFFQPSFNFIISKHFKAGLVAKFNSIYFSNIITDFNDAQLANRDLQNLDGNNISVIEAGYNLSFGFPAFKNVLFTHQLTFAGTNSVYYIRPLNFSLGLSYIFKPSVKNEPARLE